MRSRPPLTATPRSSISPWESVRHRPGLWRKPWNTPNKGKLMFAGTGDEAEKGNMPHIRPPSPRSSGSLPPIERGRSETSRSTATMSISLLPERVFAGATRISATATTEGGHYGHRHHLRRRRPHLVRPPRLDGQPGSPRLLTPRAGTGRRTTEQLPRLRPGPPSCCPHEEQYPAWCRRREPPHRWVPLRIRRRSLPLCQGLVPTPEELFKRRTAAAAGGSNSSDDNTQLWVVLGTVAAVGVIGGGAFAALRTRRSD